MLAPLPRRRTFLATSGLTLACGLLGIVWGRAMVPHAAAPLPTYGQVPAFSLTDHRGQPVTRATLAGSVWIADFIFTRCAGQCPMMSAQMASLKRALQGAPGIRLVSFSVDPSHDTPQRLADYAVHYGALDRRWLFMTGEPAAMTSLVQDGFHLGIGLDGSAREPITHSVRLVLVDQQGLIRGYYDATDAAAMAQLQRDARRLARSHAY